MRHAYLYLSWRVQRQLYALALVWDCASEEALTRALTKALAREQGEGKVSEELERYIAQDP